MSKKEILTVSLNPSVSALNIIGWKGNGPNMGLEIHKRENELDPSSLSKLTDNKDLAAFLFRINLRKIEEDDLMSFIPRMEHIRNNTVLKKIDQELKKRRRSMNRKRREQEKISALNIIKKAG